VHAQALKEHAGATRSRQSFSAWFVKAHPARLEDMDQCKARGGGAGGGGHRQRTDGDVMPVQEEDMLKSNRTQATGGGMSRSEGGGQGQRTEGGVRPVREEEMLKSNRTQDIRGEMSRSEGGGIERLPLSVLPVQEEEMLKSNRGTTQCACSTGTKAQIRTHSTTWAICAAYCMCVSMCPGTYVSSYCYMFVLTGATRILRSRMSPASKACQQFACQHVSS
jgi:hypothetical protein